MIFLLILFVLLILMSHSSLYVIQKKQLENQEKMISRLDHILLEIKQRDQNH